MVVVIKEADVDVIIRARDLKRRIEELEREIKRLVGEKRKAEEEYEKLGVKIE